MQHQTDSQARQIAMYRNVIFILDMFVYIFLLFSFDECRKFFECVIWALYEIHKTYA